ncbi:RNA polymerase sigma factor [Rhodoflexus caldus]|uniref:RNA polymerase sigma factor n=1 Tax=Rhodoflexus caldus TaxID=2891236 RepID=UPI00202A5FAB|nr:RNA polymerase sigma factor [Rhodoflexus caldus]
MAVIRSYERKTHRTILMLTDEEIMLAVSRGSPEQASELFERYHVKLFNFFLRLAGDRETAQDLTQNVFVRLIRYRSSYQEGRPFRAWVYQIARNVWQNHWKASAIGRTVPLKPAHAPPAEHTPESRAMQTEQLQHLQKALDMLPPEQRELLVMSRYQELKYDEIGQLMGLSLSAVKVKIHRAIHRLREIYFKMEGN